MSLRRVGESVRMVITRIAAGVLLALATGRLVAPLLYGLDAKDPATKACVALLMLLVAIVAAVITPVDTAP